MSDDAPAILIWIVSERLSDGSVVYNVELPGGEKIPAVTEEDARFMAGEIVDAINAHSTVEADIMTGDPS